MDSKDGQDEGNDQSVFDKSRSDDGQLVLSQAFFRLAVMRQLLPIGIRDDGPSQFNDHCAVEVIPGDGNCLFRSIHLGLGRESSTPRRTDRICNCTQIQYQTVRCRRRLGLLYSHRQY
jgi:hypothetical protein